MARARRSSSAESGEQRAIRRLIERWAKAVRDRDVAGIRADHDPDILMFDVPPPFQSRGIGAYMRTWVTFFAWAERPGVFDVQDLAITAGPDVAFATAVGHCAGRGPDGKGQDLEFRLTIGLRRIEGRWTVVHEHHSLPAAN